MIRLSRSKRIHGTIKSKAEDFRVEEIAKNGTVLEIGKNYSPEILGMEKQEGKFSIFVLQKKDWNTTQALKALARKFRRGVKSTGFAGTKDKTSISTQLCSIFGVSPGELLEAHIKDISINGAWPGSSKVEMGDLLGNRFGITVREARDAEQMPEIAAELNGIFPNYFGRQRFGIRNTNFDIGMSILKGEFKEAATNFLTNAQNETNESAKEARSNFTHVHTFG